MTSTLTTCYINTCEKLWSTVYFSENYCSSQKLATKAHTKYSITIILESYFKDIQECCSVSRGLTEKQTVSFCG